MIVSLCWVFSASASASDTLEDQALDSLIAKIESTGFYKKRLKIECLRFTKTSETKRYFEFSVYEHHDGKNCPGDTDVAPTVDRFRIFKRTKKIMLYQIVAGKFVVFGAASVIQR